MVVGGVRESVSRLMMRSQAGDFWEGYSQDRPPRMGSQTRRMRLESVNNPVVMRPPGLLVQRCPDGPWHFPELGDWM